MGRAWGAAAPPSLLLLLLLLVAPCAWGSRTTWAGVLGPAGHAGEGYPSLDGRPIFEEQQNSLGRAYPSLERDPISEHQHHLPDYRENERCNGKCSQVYLPSNIPGGRAKPSSKRHLVFKSWRNPLGVPAGRAYPSSERNPDFEHQQHPLSIAGNDYLPSERGQIFEPWQDPSDMLVDEAKGGSRQDLTLKPRQDAPVTVLADLSKPLYVDDLIVGPMYKTDEETGFPKPEGNSPVIIIPVDKTEGVDREKDSAHPRKTHRTYVIALSVALTGFLLAVIYILTLHWRIRKQEPVLPCTDSVYKTEKQTRTKSRHH